MKATFFTIGDLKISIQYDNDSYDYFFEDSYKAFTVDPMRSPDITFQVDTTTLFPSTTSHLQLFTSRPEGLWTIFEDRDKKYYLVTLQHIEKGRTPFKVIRADRNFSHFIIHNKPDKSNRIRPIQYPVEELAMTGHININRLGILLHSAGISLNGKGYLFSGTSGSGKSTIAEIWQNDKEAAVLTDERVVIRSRYTDLWTFGTPWHGTAGVHRNTGAPIDKIFFITHGTKNKAILISRKDALNKLIVRCFPTFWNREGMEFVMEFCEKIVQEKECFELEFVPDITVIDYIKRL
jgi:hypothetical protein